MMKKRFYSRVVLMSLLAMVALLPSCRSAAEKARRDIGIESVEKVTPHGLSGMDLTLRVRNDSRFKLALHTASLGVWFDGVKIGDVTLREAVEIPKRTTMSIETRWKFRVDDPIALFVLTRRMRTGDLSQVGISYDIEGRGGPMPINISKPPMPLSDFLHTFGLALDDIKSYIGQ